jgi:hypothetical protein
MERPRAGISEGVRAFELGPVSLNTDMRAQRRHVRKVPEADVASFKRAVSVLPAAMSKAIGRYVFSTLGGSIRNT